MGPDFLNSLVEVLVRFRLEKVAVVADIEQMFYQVHVSPKDRKFLRFSGGQRGLAPTTQEMTVHIFGATSSPSCAQFRLLESVETQSVSEQAKQIVVQNFFMDDCLFSVPTVSEAVSLAKQVSAALKNYGFNLTKWLSNNQDFLRQLPQDKLAGSILNLSGSEQVCERVLGVEWNISNDTFKFKVNLKSKHLLAEEYFPF